jgi:hypothetical protein
LRWRLTCDFDLLISLDFNGLVFLWLLERANKQQRRALSQNVDDEGGVTIPGFCNCTLRMFVLYVASARPLARSAFALLYSN